MIVLSIQNAPQKLRGYLTKYMFQISSGVYVSNVNSRIRDYIWERITSVANNETKAILVYSKNNEQGFGFKTLNNSWQPIDYDGLHLICIPFENPIPKPPVSESYVVLDLETTGLNPQKDEILEIGALLVENEVIISEYNAIICTEVPSDITELTGITQEMANKGTTLKNALKELGLFINGRDVVGYNIQAFDYRFLLESCKKCNEAIPIKKAIDVLKMIRRKVPDAKSYKLENIITDLEIKHVNTYHRALTDCKLCKSIYDYCRDMYQS